MLERIFKPFGFRDMTSVDRWSVRLFWIVAAALFWQFYPAGPLFPRPTGTWNAAVWMFQNGLVEDIVVSGSRIIQSAFYAFLVGSVLGYMYNIGFFQEIVTFIALLRNVMMGLIVALFLIGHITGERLILTTMFFMILVYFVSGLIQIMDDINGDLIDHGITMRMSYWQILWHRVIRGKSYFVFMAFIPCIAMGWSMLSFVEGYSRSRGGIGDRMLQIDKISSYDGLLALGIVSGLVGFGLWFSLKKFGKWKFKWAISKSV